jgi:hypothetical protein
VFNSKEFSGDEDIYQFEIKEKDVLFFAVKIMDLFY